MRRTIATIGIVAASLALASCASSNRVAGVSDAEPGSLAYDRDVFQTLLGNHELIKREVREIPDGVETTTESDNSDVAKLLRDHAHAMKARIESDRRIRQWDPMFVTVFNYASKIRMEIIDTPKGVRVRETSTDAYAARVIQAHAKMVSAFAANGSEEALRAHEPPQE